MKAFSAIVKLTFRSSMRSHIFQLLLALLLLCIVVIPVSISVGKAEEFIRVSLLYSLWAVSIILSLSSLWLGCWIMSQDIDNYQIHMVASKPVSRITIWLGKWTGINLINIILLAISAVTIYGIVMFRYQSAGQESRLAERQSERVRAESEKERIRTKILVGRRSFHPTRPDFRKIVDEQIKRTVNAAANEGKRLSDDEIAGMRSELLKRLTAPVEIAPGKAFVWTFENLPLELNDTGIYLRYRPYLGKISSEDQSNSYWLWQVAMPFINPENKTFNVYPQALSQQPEMLMTGVFHEKVLPKGVITPDGKVQIMVTNFDRYGKKHYYQQADGPQLLVPVTGFVENYLRGMLVMVIQLLLLSGLACALGGILTMPTAIFMVCSYLLFGSFSMILTDSEFYAESAFDHLGQFIAGVLLWGVIPLQRFDVTDLLAGGYLVEYAFIGKLFLKYFVLRGMPLFVAGILLYCVRELGAAVRK